jgi:hypothetical protein
MGAAGGCNESRVTNMATSYFKRTIEIQTAVLAECKPELGNLCELAVRLIGAERAAMTLAASSATVRA